MVARHWGQNGTDKDLRGQNMSNDDNPYTCTVSGQNGTGARVKSVLFHGLLLPLIGAASVIVGLYAGMTVDSFLGLSRLVYGR